MHGVPARSLPLKLLHSQAGGGLLHWHVDVKALEWFIYLFLLVFENQITAASHVNQIVMIKITIKDI